MKRTYYYDQTEYVSKTQNDLLSVMYIIILSYN